MKDQIRTCLIPVTHLPPECHHGYANGYVGVPIGHPWFGVNYDSINADVHGGLTYGEHNLPFHPADSSGLYWVGFDVCHYGDNLTECDALYCVEQLNSLYQQAVDACI